MYGKILISLVLPLQIIFSGLYIGLSTYQKVLTYLFILFPQNEEKLELLKKEASLEFMKFLSSIIMIWIE